MGGGMTVVNSFFRGGLGGEGALVDLAAHQIGQVA